MPNAVLILPELHGEPSLLRSNAGAFGDIAKRSEVGLLSPIPENLCFEMACLGADADPVPDGPLAVAALGFDPPSWSVHYRLGLMSLTPDGKLAELTVRLPKAQFDEVLEMCQALETRRLTILGHSDELSALVLENGSPDIRTLAPREASGKLHAECLPEGEDEIILRRFIDDSANILLESEVNIRRADEGLEPISLLWPWGGGFQPICTDLSLKWGPISVITGSFRMAGAARLCRLRPDGLDWAGAGINLSITRIAEAMEDSTTVLYVDSFQHFRFREMHEECGWLASELATKLIEPLWNSVCEHGGTLAIASPGREGGMWMVFDPSHTPRVNIPFDERALESPGQNRSTMANVFSQVVGLIK